MRPLSTLAILPALLIANAGAQTPATIERIRITDNDLTCQQIFDERAEMDRLIDEARQAQASGQSTATAGQAAGVAAEVAGRTGLFGALGGIGGHLLGTIAGKTAASMTEQKGNQGAAQAAEREKQALGRKEQLAAVFVAKGCSASDPSAPARTPEAAIPLPKPAVAVAAKTTGEALKEAESHLKPLSGEVALKNDLTAEHRGYSKVVVPQFRVAFVAKTGVSARADAALSNLGQSTGQMRTITQAQSRRVDMMLGNVDYPLMQGIADRLHADFLDRLRAAGKEVVAPEAMRQSSGYAKVKFLPADKPYTKSPFDDRREYILAAPAALPLAFMHIDTHLGNAGPFDQDTTKAFAEIGATLNALVLVPTVIIDFAELESSGNSRLSTTAQAEATPKVGVAANTLLIAMVGKDARIFFHGDARFARLAKPIFVEGDFGTVKSVDSFDNVALANSLTALSGAQGTQYRYDKRLVSADPGLYASRAFQAGATINQGFVDGLKP